jgi:drug/metabolite transporter (DMT)-like permease
MQTSYLRGVPFCLVATVSWGCMFPVMTSALTQMDPFNFTAIRYTIAAIPSPSCSWPARVLGIYLVARSTV